MVSMPKFVEEQSYHTDTRASKQFAEYAGGGDKSEVLLPRVLDTSWPGNVTRLTVGNMSHRPTSCGPTHPAKTSVTLVSIVRGTETIPWSTTNETEQAIDVVVGDVMVFLLEARDERGRSRLVGGDYWHAVMRNENITSDEITASTVGRIFDHKNGQYTLRFVAAWSGVVRIFVRLVHPSDFTKWFKTEYFHQMNVPRWTGVFRVGKRTEESACFLSLDATWTKKCAVIHSSALTYSRLICDPPKTLPCDSLTSMTSASNFHRDVTQHVPKAKQKFLKRPYLYAKISNVPGAINVIGGNGKREHILADESVTLPSCQPNMDVPLTQGYWWNETWYSLVCGPRITLTKTTVRQCLRNFNVYLLGDSTTRQWFAAFTEVLGLGRKEDHERVFTLQRLDKEANLNLFFHFHPLTVHPPSVIVNISSVRFEADVILELPNHCRNVVVFSPWAHFCIWQWEAYTDWLKGIRAAILVARRTCPNLVVVAKSPHPVNLRLIKPGRDFIFNEMRTLVREIFKDIGIIFIDIWDMDLASPWPIALHMPSDVINEEISLLLCYICPSITDLDRNHPL